MKRLLMLAPVLALIAGCAANDSGGYRGTVGSVGSGIDAGYGNGIAPTQQGAGAVGLTTTQLSSSDLTFLRRAAQDGQAEVQMGQTIVQNAQNPGLKQLGNRLIADHTAANQQLQALAVQKSVVIPTKLDPEHQRMLDQMSSLSGPNFDRSAEQQLVSDHQQDIQLYQNAANTSQDPQIKAFAQGTLPVLQQHLDMAQQLLNGNTTLAPTGTVPPAQ